MVTKLMLQYGINPFVVVCVGMIVLNVATLTFGLVCECRIKINALRFAIAYVCALPSLLRGNMDGFFAAMTMPVVG